MMKKALFLILLLLSSQGHSSTGNANQVLLLAAKTADLATVNFLRNYETADVEISGYWSQVNNAYKGSKRAGLSNLVEYRVCYKKQPNGVIHYCYEFRNRLDGKIIR